VIATRRASARRRKPGHGHDAGFALNHGVVAGQMRVRSRLAVAADRAIDQPWIDRRHGPVIESELGEAAGPEVLDQHVGGLNQPAQRLRAFLLLEIERDALLAPIELEEEAAPAVDVRPQPRESSPCSGSSIFNTSAPCRRASSCSRGRRQRALRSITRSPFSGGMWSPCAALSSTLGTQLIRVKYTQARMTSTLRITRVAECRELTIMPHTVTTCLH